MKFTSSGLKDSLPAHTNTPGQVIRLCTLSIWKWNLESRRKWQPKLEAYRESSSSSYPAALCRVELADMELHHLRRLIQKGLQAPG